MKWSTRVGTFAGIGVYVHATFFILLAWVAFTHWQVDRSVAAAVGGVAFILALFLCGAARVRARADGAALRHQDPRYHAAAHRRPRPARADARRSASGAVGGAGRPGRERRHRRRAVRRALLVTGTCRAGHARSRVTGGSCLERLHDRQPLAGGLQHAAGLSHGRRTRAAGAAGHPDGLHPRDADRGHHRPGHGGAVRPGGPVRQPVPRSSSPCSCGSARARKPP